MIPGQLNIQKGKRLRNCITLLVGSRLIKVIEVASNKIGNLFAIYIIAVVLCSLHRRNSLKIEFIIKYFYH